MLTEQVSQQIILIIHPMNVYLTGVQLEVGSVLTDFEHLGLFIRELKRCQRYYFW